MNITRNGRKLTPSMFYRQLDGIVRGILNIAENIENDMRNDIQIENLLGKRLYV
jgi:hypothetical protein